MNLYIDVGNSRVKIHWHDAVQYQYFYLDTRQSWTLTLLTQEIAKLQIPQLKIDNVWMCSVVPGLNALFEEVFLRTLNLKIKFLTNELKIGLNFRIDEPRKLGADLIALSVFLQHQTPTGIVINFGTATTLVYVKDSSINGAIIAPGIEIGKKSLIKNADQLKDVALQFSGKKVGQNTSEALSIGVVNGHAYMVEALVRRIDPTAQVFYSGGNATYFRNYLQYTYVKEATIEGLKIVAKMN